MSDDFSSAFWSIVALAVIGVIAIISLTVAIPVGIVWFGAWAFYQWKFKSPAALEKKAREQTYLIYEEAKKRCEVPGEEKVILHVLPKFPDLPDELGHLFLDTISYLYEAEGFDAGVPKPPAQCHGIEGARYRDYIASLSAKANPEMVYRMADLILESFRDFLSNIPKIGEDSKFTAPLHSYVDIGKTIEDLVLPYFKDERLFKHIKEMLNKNIHEVSGIPLREKDHPDLILPTDYEGDDILVAYLKNTPFLDFFNVPIPVDIPDQVRFEHSWCIAPPGTGKTQLIQYLVSHDLTLVQEGKASIVVMDSAGDLIKQISSLKVFAPGEPLHGKVIVIRPDLVYPPALNLFDMGRDRLKTYGETEREKFTNSAIDQLTYVLEAMLGEAATLTAKQETLFRYIIRLMMVMPEVNLDTFSELLEARKPAQLVPYQKYIDKLPKPAQDYFNTQFTDKDFNPTRDQVKWRLSRLRENTIFDRMFSHPRSKLDLFNELNESKVILIHTDIENLKAEGTNILGRYFIGALLSASQERASLAFKNRLPVYAYIDECQDYIANDTKIASLLDQARKMNIGMFLAHQRTAQIKDRNVLDALANTAIKYANTDNPNDLPLIAKAMRTNQDFIATQKKGHFAISARRTVEAFSFRVPFFVLENMEKMNEEEEVVVKQELRDKYCSKYEKVYKPNEEEVTSLKAAEEKPDYDNPEV